MDGAEFMIECQLCEEYFDEEDMTECPECLKEMCESCYERHVPICFYVSEHDSGDIDS